MSRTRSNDTNNLDEETRGNGNGSCPICDEEMNAKALASHIRGHMEDTDE